MILYHYTNNVNKIKKEGINRYYKSNSTDIINDCILKVKEELPIDRDYCIYLSFDKRNDGNYICEIDINDLNIDNLYVANEHFADIIYDSYMTGKDYGKYIEDYCNSVVPFNEYLNKEVKYEKAEVIYLGEVSTDAITRYSNV
ncbi:MAG: hypothetical protein K0R54_538 [Clostridiaceae bacterium]|jgi:hypothetical protein|nr:hypothetical protein [Clostridiaceae bacterium]